MGGGGGDGYCDQEIGLGDSNDKAIDNPLLH